MANLLKAENLSKQFKGRKVVQDVSFEINAGEVVGLLGPNGAGKTTSFYMVVGMLQPDNGNVSIDGMNIAGFPMHKRARLGVSYLPQEPSIFRKLTVKDNIMAVLENMDYNRNKRIEILNRLLEDFGIGHVAAQHGATLSGGERRRVEIARALAITPSFILLDEPFAGIDPIAVADIQDIIRKLKSDGIGILITDHNVRDTLGICDRGYILSEGKMLEQGTPEHIAESPLAREVYLGENFKL